MNDLSQVFMWIKDELREATSKFEVFNTPHEGYAILLEELDELWTAIKLKQDKPKRERQIIEEAVHVATMSVRFIIDCCLKKKR